MKRFKTKKRVSFNSIRKIIVISIIFLLITLLSTAIENIKLSTNNEEFLKCLLEDSNHHLVYKKHNSKLSTKLLRFLTSFNMEKPETILVSNNSIYERDSMDIEEIHKIDSQMYYVKSPVKQEKNDPIVYIYNSHQSEEYNSDEYEGYNIKPGVMMASYILKDYLEKKGIHSIVEEGNINEFLNLNNWNYNYSYDASRYFINDTLEKNPSIKYIIDLHRDAVIKDASTTVINNKSYAKVIFVVGLEHPNYQKNLDNVEKLNSIINKDYPTLSRGILKKAGAYVNGIYNQDISENAMLIEVGGYENTIEEVINTLEALSQVIKEYIDENS